MFLFRNWHKFLENIEQKKKEKCFFWKWTWKFFVNKESKIYFRKFRKKELFAVPLQVENLLLLVTLMFTIEIKRLTPSLNLSGLIFLTWDICMSIHYTKKLSFFFFYQEGLLSICLVREQTVFHCKVCKALTYIFPFILNSSQLFNTLKVMTDRIQYSNIYLTSSIHGRKVSSIWLLTSFLFIFWWLVLSPWLQHHNLRSHLVIHHKLWILELLHQERVHLFLPVQVQLQFFVRRFLTLT